MCQSCGMPLSKDPKNGGTNKDGSKSDKYCSYCYKDGKFMLSWRRCSKLCREWGDIKKEQIQKK